VCNWQWSVCSSSTTDEEVPMISVPSKLSDPVARHDGGMYVTVKWTKPEDNGRSDITGYVIKYGDRFTDVDKYDELLVHGNRTNFELKLTDDRNNRTSYRFAVSAVNSAGRGEFSEFTDYVCIVLLARHRTTLYVRWFHIIQRHLPGPALGLFEVFGQTALPTNSV